MAKTTNSQQINCTRCNEPLEVEVQPGVRVTSVLCPGCVTDRAPVAAVPLASGNLGVEKPINTYVARACPHRSHGVCEDCYREAELA